MYRLRNQFVLYSTAAMYVAAVAVLLLVVEIGSLSLVTGLFALTGVTFAVLQVAVRQEQARMARRLNLALARIKELTDILIAEGIAVPEDLTREDC